MKKYLFLILVMLPLCAMAQRHSKGIGGIDLFGGMATAKYTGWNAGLGYSHYISTNDIFRITGEYLQYNRRIYTRDFDIRNYTGNIEYLRTVLSNHNNLYINLGLGVKGGYEDIGEAKDFLNSEGRISDIKSRFIVAPLVTGEIEFFALPKTAILFQVKETYSPMSDLQKWGTTVGIGIRHLIF